jgi:hypothetical protein
MRERFRQDIPYLTRLIKKANENARYPKVMYIHHTISRVKIRRLTHAVIIVLIGYTDLFIITWP